MNMILFCVMIDRHTHEVETVTIKVQEVVRAIKRRAVENLNAPPSEIFRAEVSGIVNQELLSNLPQKNDVMQ